MCVADSCMVGWVFMFHESFCTHQSHPEAQWGMYGYIILLSPHNDTYIWIHQKVSFWLSFQSMCTGCRWYCLIVLVWWLWTPRCGSTLWPHQPHTVPTAWPLGYNQNQNQHLKWPGYKDLCSCTRVSCSEPKHCCRIKVLNRAMSWPWLNPNQPIGCIRVDIFLKTPIKTPKNYVSLHPKLLGTQKRWKQREIQWIWQKTASIKVPSQLIGIHCITSKTRGHLELSPGLLSQEHPLDNIYCYKNCCFQWRFVCFTQYFSIIWYCFATTMCLDWNHEENNKKLHTFHFRFSWNKMGATLMLQWYKRVIFQMSSHFAAYFRAETALRMVKMKTTWRNQSLERVCMFLMFLVCCR